MQNKNIINKVFYISLAAIFVIFLAVVLITIFRPFDYKKISHLKDTSFEQCLKKEKTGGDKQKQYYVLIYQKDSKDIANIEEVVVKYANETRKNKELPEIYTLEYNSEIAEDLNELISALKDESDVPYMFIVSTSGTVSTKYDSCSSINNALIKKMSE